MLDYLQYLEKASDVEPVDINKIATKYLNTESDLSDQMMKVALLGAVARRFGPGCQFDSAVVLKGDQGIQNLHSGKHCAARRGSAIQRQRTAKR